MKLRNVHEILKNCSKIVKKMYFHFFKCPQNFKNTFDFLEKSQISIIYVCQFRKMFTFKKTENKN